MTKPTLKTDMESLNGCGRASAFSFDHLVGENEKRLGNGDAERFRSPQVHHEFELARLLDREVSRFDAIPQNLVHERRGISIYEGQVFSIAHKAAGAAEIREGPGCGKL